MPRLRQEGEDLGAGQSSTRENEMQSKNLRKQRLLSRRNGRGEQLISELLAEELGIPIAEVRAKKKARRARAVALATKLHLSVADASWLICICDGGIHVPEEMTKEHADRTLEDMRVRYANTRKKR